MAAESAYFFTPFVLMFLPEQCHDEFFLKFNFLHVPCLKIAAAKCLGYAIVLGAAIVKVPQILKCLGAKSGEGISLLSLFGELCAITFTMSYSIHNKFPFSAWGEGLFMSIQDAILVVLIYYFNKQHMGYVVFTPIYCAVTYALCSDLTPMWLVTRLQGSVLVIIIIARGLQIWANFVNGHTGQLSFVTAIMLFAGSSARVFTTIQETGDVLMTTQFITAASLNGIVFAQILWYWKVSPKKSKRE